MPNYRDMYELFQHDPQAKQYYDRLPDYVREQIATRAGGVNSSKRLRDYAEKLTRGDD
jgi:hypothetical protein